MRCCRALTTAKGAEFTEGVDLTGCSGRAAGDRAQPRQPAERQAPGGLCAGNGAWKLHSIE